MKQYHHIFNIEYVLTAIARPLYYQHSIPAIASTAQTPVDIKRAALTFDDGPHPVYTAQLLDELKKREVKATFFVTGEHAELHPELIKRMHDEGHLIGNHTYSHIQLTASNKNQFKEELIQTNEILHDITGAEVQYVRPPYGSWDKKFETDLNMFPVLWNVDPLDWCTANAESTGGKHNPQQNHRQ